MARVCVRPGCDLPAQARLTHDVVTCQVWIDPIADWPGGAQEICEMHLARLTVPRGWVLCDRRVEAPALFVADDALPKVSNLAAADPEAADRTDQPGASKPTPVPAGRPGRRRSQSVAEAPDLVLFTHGSPESEQVTEPAARQDADPPAEPAAESPTADEDVEPDAEPDVEPDAEPDVDAENGEVAAPKPVKPSSPLLARAFAAAGPQRSVLTHYVEKHSSQSD